MRQGIIFLSSLAMFLTRSIKHLQNLVEHFEEKGPYSMHLCLDYEPLRETPALSGSTPKQETSFAALEGLHENTIEGLRSSQVLLHSAQNLYFGLAHHQKDSLVLNRHPIQHD